jgi:hypothetical protein
MMQYRGLCLAAAMVLVMASVALAQPANDDFGSARVVPGLPFTATAVDTTEATVANDDPNTSCFGPTATVWYTFTLAQDLRVEVNTLGSDYDTTLSIWTGSRGSLSEIACNDDRVGFLSRVRFDAVAGQTYFVMAGTCCGSEPGSVGPGGSLSLAVIPAPPPLQLDLAVDRFGSIDSQTGGAVIRGTVTCSRSASVSVEGGALQSFNRAKIEGFFSVFVESCNGRTGWEALAVDDNFRFGGGQAQVFVSASVPDEDVSDQANRRVTLRRGK